MDSQATLVNPSELPDRYAHTELVFDRDSLTNANLRVRGGRAVVYSIKTGKSMLRTELCKFEDSADGGGSPSASDSAVSSARVLVTVARIERKGIFPDTITFQDCAPMKIRKWLKKRSFTVSFPDTGESMYVWKPTSLREIALYNEQNPFTPVAWFRTIRRYQVDGVEMIEMPALSMQPEAERIQKLVLASLLIVEQKFRMKSQRAGISGPRVAVIPY